MSIADFATWLSSFSAWWLLLPLVPAFIAGIVEGLKQ